MIIEYIRYAIPEVRSAAFLAASAPHFGEMSSTVGK